METLRRLDAWTALEPEARTRLEARLQSKEDPFHRPAVTLLKQLLRAELLTVAMGHTSQTATRWTRLQDPVQVLRDLSLGQRPGAQALAFRPGTLPSGTRQEPPPPKAEPSAAEKVASLPVTEREGALLQLLRGTFLAADERLDARKAYAAALADALPYEAKARVLGALTHGYFELVHLSKRAADYALRNLSGAPETMVDIVERRGQPPRDALWWYHDEVCRWTGPNPDRLNPDELLALCFSIRDALRRGGSTSHVTLYGSVANFKSTRRSDVDVKLPWAPIAAAGEHPMLAWMNPLLDALGSKRPQQGFRTAVALGAGQGGSVEGALNAVSFELSAQGVELCIHEHASGPPRRYRVE